MNDAKTFLREIRSERQEIRILDSKIMEKRYELLPGAIRYDTDKVQASPQDNMSVIFAEIDKYEKALKKHMTKLQKRQKKAADMISRIPSSEQRQVMELYYMSPVNPTWDDVADELSYSRRAVLNYHGDALCWLNEHIVFLNK